MEGWSNSQGRLLLNHCSRQWFDCANNTSICLNSISIKRWLKQSSLSSCTWRTSKGSCHPTSTTAWATSRKCKKISFSLRGTSCTKIRNMKSSRLRNTKWTKSSLFALWSTMMETASFSTSCNFKSTPCSPPTNFNQKSYSCSLTLSTNLRLRLFTIHSIRLMTKP